MQKVNPGLQMIDGEQFNLLIAMLSNGANGLTALSGGGQAGATQLRTGLNSVDTVAADHDSVLLGSAQPAPQIGVTVFMVANNSAHILDVFPMSGDAIAGAGANNAFSIGANKSAIFFCALQGHWGAVLSA